MSGPVMHASVSRKWNLGNFQSKEVTVGISQVPLHATDAMIADMLQCSARIVDALDRQIEGQFAPYDMAAIKENQPEVKLGGEEAVSTVKIIEDDRVPEVHNPQPEREIIASGTATTWEEPTVKRIPDESEIVLNTLNVLGIDILAPTPEMLIERIPESAPEGGQSRTMKHLNAALTSAGFPNEDRHWASLALIQAAYGGIARTELKSLKDLTMGEASIVTSWLMEAGESHLSELRRVTSALKGQLVIGEVAEPEQCCDLFPFGECCKPTRSVVHV